MCIKIWYGNPTLILNKYTFVVRFFSYFLSIYRSMKRWGNSVSCKKKTLQIVILKKGDFLCISAPYVEFHKRHKNYLCGIISDIWSNCHNFDNMYISTSNLYDGKASSISCWTNRINRKQFQCWLSTSFEIKSKVSPLFQRVIFLFSSLQFGKFFIATCHIQIWCCQWV